MSLNHVIFAADENYSFPLRMAIYSLSRENPASLTIHVLYSFLADSTQEALKAIAQNSQNKIVFHCVDENRFANQTTKIEYISKATYYRYLIPELLVGVSKALYLDADILVNRNINDVFETNLGDYYVAGVEDRCIEKREDGTYLDSVGMGHLKSCYVNAGVLLLNLDKIRQDGLQKRFFDNDEALQNKIQFQDQDVLNYTFNGNVLLLNKMMNWMSYDRDRRRLLARFANPYIVHYTGPHKPWVEVKQFWDRRYRDIQDEYLAS